MKEETKKQLLRLTIMFAPVFTFIMYLLPWMGFYNESFQGTVSVTYTPIYYSYFDLLLGDVGVYAKIVMWISLVGVASSLIMYVFSSVFKDKEKLLIKIAAITLVSATTLLIFTVFGQFVPSQIYGNGKLYKWVNFVSLPYGLLMVYNIASLIYVVKKMAK